MSYDFASTQIDIPSNLKDNILKYHKYIDRNDLDKYGLENDPHVTVLYGLNDMDISKVKDIIRNTKPFSIRTMEFDLFRNDEHDVLILKINGESLYDLNKKIDTIPNSNTHKEYKPHLTIAYLKKGIGEKYLRMFKNYEPNIDIPCNNITFSKVTGDKIKLNMDSSIVEMVSNF